MDDFDKCEKCGVGNDSLKRCTGCKNTYYCSKECQVADWSKHKLICFEFPVAYKDQYDKDVYWICDLDEEKRITSVFIGHGEKYNAYMTLSDVKIQIEKLKTQGWIKVNRPKVELTFDK